MLLLDVLTYYISVTQCVLRKGGIFYFYISIFNSEKTDFYQIQNDISNLDHIHDIALPLDDLFFLSFY